MSRERTDIIYYKDHCRINPFFKCWTTKSLLTCIMNLWINYNNTILYNFLLGCIRKLILHVFLSKTVPWHNKIYSFTFYYNLLVVVEQIYEKKLL